MAREMGKHMAVTAIRLQTSRRGNQQKGTGLVSLAGSALKQALTSEAIKEAASAGVGTLPQDQDKGSKKNRNKKNTESKRRHFTSISCSCPANCKD